MTERTSLAAPRILVDADACPVKDEILRVAARYGVVVVLVANGGLRPSRDPMVQTVVVPSGADAADDWIIDHAEPNDVAITSDIPLAARLLDKNVLPLSPKGDAFTEAGIGMALAMRDLKQQIRESTQGQTYNAAFSPKHRSAFLQSLDRALIKRMPR